MPNILIVDKSDTHITVHDVPVEVYQDLVRKMFRKEPMSITLSGDNRNSFYRLREIHWAKGQVRRIEWIEGPASE